jgi:hypothetical protein
MFSHLTNTNITTSTGTCLAEWRAESHRVGSDWVSISDAVVSILHRLRATSSSWSSSL